MINAYVYFEDLDVISASDILNNVVPYIPAEISFIATAEFMKDEGTKAIIIIHQTNGDFEYPSADINGKQIIRHMASKKGEDSQEMDVLTGCQSPLQSFLIEKDEARRLCLRN